MQHGCENCPGEHALKIFLTYLFEIEDRQFISNIPVLITKQCDKAVSLISLQIPVEEFIEELSHSLQNLSEHHFIAKKQGAYSKNIKENLIRRTAVVLMVFDENYSF